MNCTDADIVALIEKDQLRGYELLYKKYFSLLMKEAYAILKQKDEAEDEVQQLFLNICQKRLVNGKIDNLGGYLVKSVRNRALNALPKRSKWLSEEAAKDVPQVANTALQQLTAGEIRESLEKKLALLSPKCRQVFEWRFFLGLSHKEIAEKANISLNTVDNHLAKATKILRNGLQGHFKEIFTTTILWLLHS